MKKFLLCLLLLYFTFTDVYAQSTVKHFEYGAFDNKRIATLKGSVSLLTDNADTVKGDVFTFIALYDRYDMLVSTISVDVNGQFSFELLEGKFSLKFIRKGYERLEVSNFQAKPGQNSTIEVIMTPGKKTRSYRLSKSKSGK